MLVVFCSAQWHLGPDPRIAIGSRACQGRHYPLTCQRGRACYAKCFTNRTLPVPANCSNLLAQMRGRLLAVCVELHTFIFLLLTREWYRRNARFIHGLYAQLTESFPYHKSQLHSALFSVVTRPRAGWSGVLTLAEKDINFSSKNVQTDNNLTSLHRHINLVPEVLIVRLSG
jgi:hypothetical protein